MRKQINLEDITPFVPDRVFKENKEKATERNRKLKINQTKETILAYFIMGFILIITIAFIAVNNRDTATVIDKCVASGKTTNYCIKNT